MPLWRTGKDMRQSEISLKEMSIPEIETLLAEYPWYTAARRELFLKLSARGEDYRKEALRRNLLYIYPDHGILKEGYVLSTKSVQQEYLEEGAVFVFDISEIGEPSVFVTDREAAVISSEEVLSYDAEEDVISLPEIREEPARKVYIAGGDYFSREELEEVEDDDFSSLKIGLTPESFSELDSSEFYDEEFYTETLARIYAQQELYDRANEV